MSWYTLCEKILKMRTFFLEIYLNCSLWLKKFLKIRTLIYLEMYIHYQPWVQKLLKIRT